VPTQYSLANPAHSFCDNMDWNLLRQIGLCNTIFASATNEHLSKLGKLHTKSEIIDITQKKICK
jgi:hypothetical protein